MEFSVKKLVASFLVLSALTGAVSLAIYNFDSIKHGISKDGSTNESGLAFTGRFSGEESGGSIEDGLGGAVNTSGNMTEKLGKSIFRRVLLNNPNGFQVNADGEAVGNPASSEDIKLALEEINSEDLKPREILDGELKIGLNSDGEKTKKYIEELTVVLIDTIGSEKYDNLLKQEPSLETTRKVEDILNQAEKGLLKINVPQEAVVIHKSFINYTRSHRDFYNIITDYENDPVKTLLVLEKQKDFLKNDLSGFENEARNLLSLNTEQNKFSGLWGGLRSGVSSLFVVNEAQAQQPTFDAITAALQKGEWGSVLSMLASTITGTTITTSNYTQKLLEWAQKLATEKLKNHLTKLFVQQILAWTNNDGNQRFVYNWESFLTDVAEEVASDAMDEFVPTLCGPFQDYVLQSQGFLGLSGRSLLGGRSKCPLKDGGANLGNFYKDFNNGGWDEYLGSLSPTGNLIGSILATDNHVGSRKSNALEAKVNELLANRGYLSQQKCADKSEPGRGDVCADGSKPRATTPGGLVGDTLSKAFGAPLDRVVNAADLIGLVVAITDSAISGVLADGQSKIDGVLGLASTGFGSRDGGSLGDVVCSGLTGEALTQCLVGATETEGVITDHDTTTQSSGEARRVGTLWQDVKEANEDSLDIITQLTVSSQPGIYLGLFDLIQYGAEEGKPRQLFPKIPGCLYDSGDPLSDYRRDKEVRRMQVDDLRAQIPGLKAVIEELNSEIDYEDLQREIGTAPSSESLQAILAKYGTPEEIEAKKQIAKDRLIALRALKTRVEENLAVIEVINITNVTPPYDRPEKSACNVELPIDVFAADSPILINP